MAKYLGMYDGEPLYYIQYNSDEWWNLMNKYIDGITTFGLYTTSIKDPTNHLVY